MKYSNLILILICTYLTGCQSSVPPDPVKIGRLTYSTVAIAIKDKPKDQAKLAKTIVALKALATINDSPDNMLEFIESGLIELKIDPVWAAFIVSTLDLYWEDIELAIKAKTLPASKYMDYFRGFVKGFTQVKTE